VAVEDCLDRDFERIAEIRLSWCVVSRRHRRAF
jgi:hypothetical protein